MLRRRFWLSVAGVPEEHSFSCGALILLRSIYAPGEYSFSCGALILLRNIHLHSFCCGAFILLCSIRSSAKHLFSRGAFILLRSIHSPVAYSFSYWSKYEFVLLWYIHPTAEYRGPAVIWATLYHLKILR